MQKNLLEAPGYNEGLSFPSIPDGPVKYKFLNGTYDKDLKRTVFPETYLPGTSTASAGKDGFTKLAVLNTAPYDTNGRAVSKAIKRKSFEGDRLSATNGEIVLNPKNSPADREWFYFMELAAEKEGNSEEVAPMWKRIDEQAEANDRRTKREKQIKALNIAMELQSGKELDAAAAKFGFIGGTDEQMRDKLEEYASNSPEEFMQRMGNGGKESETAIRKAIADGTITLDPNTNKVVLASSGQELLSVPDAKNKENAIGAITSWIETTEEGKQFAEGQLNADKAKKTTAKKP